MKYKDKTKEQLKPIEDLEAEETRLRQAEFVSNVYLVDHKRSIFILDNNK